MENVIKFDKDYIELFFTPRWVYVEFIWDFVNKLLGEIISKKQADLVSMSISELVENSVKYSNQHRLDNSVRMKLEVKRKEKMILFEIENLAQKEHTEVLKQQLEEIKKFKDSKEAFREKLKEAAVRTDGRSQLGLVRIIHEAKGDINIFHINDKICVRVKFDLVINNN